MAKPVGSLIVQIGANTRGLTRGGRRMETTLGKWRRQANQTAKRMSMIGSAAAAAAVAITSKLVSAQLKAVDAAAKLSDRVGATTQSLAGLRHAAELTGAGAQKLDEGLNVLQKRLGEVAVKGTGAAADAIDKLGLNVNELINMRPGEQMRAIAEAMQGLSTQAERNAVAANLFSRANQDLVNTLALGRDGLNKMQKEAEELGLAFDRVDAAKVEAANDSISRVSAAMSGLARKFTVEVAPIITVIGKKLVGLAKDSNNFRGTAINALEGAAVAIAHVNNAVKGLQIAFEALKIPFHVVIGVVSQGLGDLVKLNRDATNAIINSVNKVIEAWNKLGIAQMDTIGILKRGEFEKAAHGMAQASAEAIGDIIDKMDEIALSGMSSDQVRKQFQQIREEAQKTAESMAAAAGGGSVPSGGGQGGDGSDQSQQDEEEAKLHREKLQQRLERIREAGMTQREIEQEQFEQRMEWLREAKEKEMITEQQFRQNKEALEKKHNDKMAELRRQGLSKLEKFQEMSFTSQASMVAGQMANMTASVAGESKRMFEINKTAAIADAIISAYQGISKTLAQYPFPLSAVMAAAQAAVAFAQVSKIKSQSFSGGGSTAPSVSASTPAGAQATSDAGGGQGDGGGGRTVNATFNVEGESISKRQFRDMIEGLNETIDDGAQLGQVRVN